MNEKYAKNLRKQAAVMAAQMVEHGRTVTTERVHQPSSGLNPDTVVNSVSSLRGIYRYLKKNDRQKQ